MDSYKIIWDKLKNTIDSKLERINQNPADVETNFAKRVKELVEEDQLEKIKKIMKVLEQEIQENK